MYYCVGIFMCYDVFDERKMHAPIAGHFIITIMTEYVSSFISE